MQVPTVTLEDLQAFHAQHFPGHETPNAPATQPVDNDEYNEEAGEEEDLGYYPDGVKRTLTDEQIRIFRHSEIHALLRASQLAQDDAEYEARRNLPEEGPVGEGQSNKVQETPEVKQKSVPTSKKPKRAAEHMHNAVPELDYEEKNQPSSPKKAHKQSDNIYPGRRIVSYND
ncbi:hypothetical protein N7478_011494 [Penicillium angulare]|uniref:uncharacterized protein n=1 Tax=Penicillium angulare TaxID=116970 RepID=UPI002541F224|nr:uncharacterized protein N7478_011494 [Penicillium angulare]KAJ5263889.1 hypothetical protein N7478_011494 [Penicillium angulare]